jgi:hypothetical protein
MALVLYLTFLAAAAAFALADWRRAWLLVVVAGVLQDPVRKLTPGSPVVISFAVVGLYAAIVFSARNDLIAHIRDFGRRFPQLYSILLAFIFLLIVAAMNGMVTFGFANWKVPTISLVTYLVPLVAALVGYTWLQRETAMERFFAFYAVLTSIALAGTIAEYFRVESSLLGMVSTYGDYVRHLPGIQIRMLSGFYRSPDIMAWHAATLSSIGIGMALRHGFGRRTLIWGSVAAWGFLSCMLGGRRKAVYYVVAFVAVFLWRYIRRVQNSQMIAFSVVLLLLYLVVRQLASGEETNVYARGATASRSEIFQRLEGGAFETFQQVGLMGAGLGAATQGMHHLVSQDRLGWQEGGMGKIAIEIGLPGILALILVVWVAGALLLRLTRIGDVEGSSQFMRAMLFALFLANAVSFMASAQAYSEPVLALTTGFFVGCLFATAALDERLAASQRAKANASPQLTSPAPA